MTLWDIRQAIETRIPAWGFLLFIAVCLIGVYVAHRARGGKT